VAILGPRHIHTRAAFALLAILIVCLAPARAHAASPLQVGSLAVAPMIDGEIGESEWTGAGAADQDFIQIEPAYGEASPFRTVIRVGQTATALYVAIEAFDPDIERLSAAVTQRDAISSRDNNGIPNMVQDDTVAVLLDPFGDGRTAYIFRTNALATQEDGRIADNGRAVDLQWDGAWRSAAVRRNDRWTIEFEIPFSILIYAGGMDRAWKANFVRTIPRRLETSVWSGPAESVFRVSGFGDLTGIETPAQSADVWQFIPYGILSYELEKGARAEFGGDVRWRPSSNLGADLTFNPDFALVDADVEVVNLTRFEVQVPEKRPFFLEGTEMYNQRYRQFHSRRMGDITWGAKTNGRIAGADFSLITAAEDLRLQNRAGSAGEKTAYYGILRVQQSLGRGSNIGLLATNRNLGSENAGSFGFDTTTYFTDTLSFNGQIFEVHGPTADGGIVWYMRPSYDTSTTHFHIRWGHFAPGIRNDFNVLGFLQDDDRKEIDTNLSHIFFFDEGWLERVRPSVNFGRYTSFDQGVLRGYALSPRLEAVLRNGLEFELNYRNEYRLFEKGYYNQQTNFIAAWNGRDGRYISANVGTGVNFDNDLFLYGGEARWAFGDSWRISYTLTRVELSPDYRNESTTIHVFETTYAFNPDLFVRAFFQSNSAIDKQNIQVLGVWRFNPPFGQLQVAYQKGTSAFGQQSDQGHTLFTKLAWVL
jgi:hypothetical protein